MTPRPEFAVTPRPEFAVTPDRPLLRSPRPRSVTALVLASALVLAFAPEARAADAPDRARVERGRYLVQVGGCHDCHTPSRLEPTGALVPDTTRLLSGDPAGPTDPVGQLGKGDMMLIGPHLTSFRLPFGTVRAANLTPDRDTGLGAWTEQNFLDAMRKGRSGGAGRAILPPMPWPNLAQATDDDLRAIYAYLRTIPAVKNRVEPPEVAPPVLEQMLKNNESLSAKLAPTPPPAAKPGQR